MATNDRPTFKVENAEIIYRNFEGKEGPYNRKGDRTFAVVLDPDVAEELAADGWLVKLREAREEGDDPRPYIQVAVNFNNIPPLVMMITSKGRTRLDGSTIEVLDWADIAVVDLICQAYDWEVGGKKGRKAYLKTMFVTINEDELEQKYGFSAAQKDEEVD